MTPCHWTGTALAITMLVACGDDGAPATDAGPDAAASSDDAAPSPDATIVQCMADHQESLEATNDGILNPNNEVEPTGLVLSSQSDFSICGEISPDQADGDFADVDVYEFDVSGQQELRLHLQTDSAVGTEGLELSLFAADGPSQVASGLLQGKNAVISRSLAAGTYWVAVVAKTQGLQSPVGYRIVASKSPIDCEASMTAADYSEAQDGAEHRGNDVVIVDYGTSQVFSKTPDTADSPESSGLVVTPANDRTITGLSANVDALDDYRDRDTYLIKTGASTDELSVRLGWDHDAAVDFDVHLFAANQVLPDLSVGAGSSVGTTSDELATLAVTPDTEYWIWVGLYNDVDASSPPQSYRLTLCGSDL